jgi:EAL domain-containing protein (putative c-di-GMP-specific phosphodiesterase class I)
LLRGITRLSAQLGLKVVVEGVETQEQFDLLAAEDSIDEVQGYLLCRPMPAADLRKLLYATYVAPPETSSWPAKLQHNAA